jgi:hypothetical protein
MRGRREMNIVDVWGRAKPNKKRRLLYFSHSLDDFFFYADYLLEPGEDGCLLCARKKAKKLVKKRLPILGWLPDYKGCCNFKSCH